MTVFNPAKLLKVFHLSFWQSLCADVIMVCSYPCCWENFVVQAMPDVVEMWVEVIGSFISV